MTARRTLAFAITLGLTAAASAQNSYDGAVRWSTTDGGNGHWYAVIDEPVFPGFPDWPTTWGDAHVLALTLGGELASLGSQSEKAFVASLLDTDEAHFVGGVKIGVREWGWIDGTPWSNLWHPGQPDGGWDEGFTALYRSGAQLHDVPELSPTEERVPFVIEWSVDCNGDGIVDLGQILNGTFDDGNVDGVPDCCGGNSCCPGDLDRDGEVSSADIGLLVAAWGTDGGITPAADIDTDGLVDASDLGLLFGFWGTCP